MRHVRLVHLHEVDVDEERLVRRLGRLVEELECRLLDVTVEERDTNDAFCSGVSTYWPLILKSSFTASPALPDSDPLVTFWNIARNSEAMSGNQVGSA